MVLWDDIKDDPPEELKVSPIAMILHKSRMFRTILDLSFRLRLKNGDEIPSVNESTEKNGPSWVNRPIGPNTDGAHRGICTSRT